MNIPKELDPIKACKAGLIFTGSLPGSTFKRVLDSVSKLEPVEYHWSFWADQKGQLLSELKFKATLMLLCQRCQKPLQWQLTESVAMQVVSSLAEAQNLPLAIEPILVNTEQICDPQEILEDELILALPMIPMHGEKDCSFSQNKAYYAAQTEKNTHKPFANLSKVMNLKE